MADKKYTGNAFIHGTGPVPVQRRKSQSSKKHTSVLMDLFCICFLPFIGSLSIGAFTHQFTMVFFQLMGLQLMIVGAHTTFNWVWKG